MNFFIRFKYFRVPDPGNYCQTRRKARQKYYTNGIRAKEISPDAGKKRTKGGNFTDKSYLYGWNILEKPVTRRPDWRMTLKKRLFYYLYGDKRKKNVL